ncbi:Bifunctional protein BirA [Raoultella planticola]|uniref:Bifunctional protein BirA n=1 Tax=Raoultella planticola TaxID=575 RepID=A0A485BIP8_RAOPL|nr:Bifunctional protein BirA [Raoultella planticola]
MRDNTIPLTLISILADGEFHSGEQLGDRLGMSRAAINKHIQTLRDWGLMCSPFREKVTACQNRSSY